MITATPRAPAEITCPALCSVMPPMPSNGMVTPAAVIRVSKTRSRRLFARVGIGGKHRAHQQEIGPRFGGFASAHHRMNRSTYRTGIPHDRAYRAGRQGCFTQLYAIGASRQRHVCPLVLSVAMPCRRWFPAIYPPSRGVQRPAFPCRATARCPRPRPPRPPPGAATRPLGRLCDQSPGHKLGNDRLSPLSLNGDAIRLH